MYLYIVWPYGKRARGPSGGLSRVSENGFFSSSRNTETPRVSNKDALHITEGSELMESESPSKMF